VASHELQPVAALASRAPTRRSCPILQVSLLRSDEPRAPAPSGVGGGNNSRCSGLRRCRQVELPLDGPVPILQVARVDLALVAPSPLPLRSLRDQRIELPPIKSKSRPANRAPAGRIEVERRCCGRARDPVV
jgi:hypothetical protein